MADSRRLTGKELAELETLLKGVTGRRLEARDLEVVDPQAPGVPLAIFRPGAQKAAMFLTQAHPWLRLMLAQVRDLLDENERLKADMLAAGERIAGQRDILKRHEEKLDRLEGGKKVKAK